MLTHWQLETLKCSETVNFGVKIFFCKEGENNFCNSKNSCIFATANDKTNAEIAQLVEHDLAKVGVASSSLVFRSKTSEKRFFFSRRF